MLIRNYVTPYLARMLPDLRLRNSHWGSTVDWRNDRLTPAFPHFVNFVSPENPLEGSPFNERVRSLFAGTNSLWIAAGEGGANGTVLWD